jgi:hypothetical protein
LKFDTADDVRIPAENNRAGVIGRPGQGPSMSPRRLTLFSALLLLALATAASAQDESRPAPVPGIFAQGLDQGVYKGMVGNMLEAIPMDPAQRVDLQRTNAVVSNALLGRSLAVLAGLSNPVLLLGGIVWGVWAASNIRPADAGANPGADPGQSGGNTAAQERLVALLASSTAAGDSQMKSGSEPVLVSSLSVADSAAIVPAPARVIKIWLPQRAPMLPQ